MNRSELRSHITLQPRTSCPLKLSRLEPGQHLDGRPPGKTRLLLEEVLVRPAEGAHPVVCLNPNQRCSLIFRSEYTVIFSFPASYSPVPEQPSTTTLTKQGSMLTFIFRSSCAANKKKNQEHLLLLLLLQKFAFPFRGNIGLLKVIYRGIFSNLIWSVTFHVKFKTVFL